MEYVVHKKTGEGRISSIRVDRTGAVLFFEKSAFGEVISQMESAIDPNYAQWLVERFQMNFHQLGGGGDFEQIGMGMGTSQPMMHSVGGLTLPPNMQEGMAELRNLREKLMRQQQLEHLPASSSDRSFGDSVNPLDCVIAGIGMLIGHSVVGFIALMSIGAISAMLGPVPGLILGVATSLVLVGGFFWGAGWLVGRYSEGEPERTALWSALIAVVLNLVIYYMLEGQLGSACTAWVFPFLARWGANFGSANRSRKMVV